MNFMDSLINKINTDEYFREQFPDLKARHCDAGDGKDVLRLIHSSFEVWKKDKLDLSPMHQTLDETISQCSASGIVFRDRNNNLVASISFENVDLSYSNSSLIYNTKDKAPIEFKLLAGENLKSGSYLVFKKFCVQPGKSGSGLGKAVLQILKESLNRSNYVGLALETVREAKWLYEWYLKEGFADIGVYRYPGRPLETILMVWKKD